MATEEVRDVGRRPSGDSDTDAGPDTGVGAGAPGGTGQGEPSRGSPSVGRLRGAAAAGGRLRAGPDRPAAAGRREGVTVTDRRLAGEIRDVALLDLTPMTSAEDLAGITRISDVAIVLVPESLMAAAAGIPMDDVAMVVPVPDGIGVRTHTGALVMAGEALAGPGGGPAPRAGRGT